jgi:protein MpaA
MATRSLGRARMLAVVLATAGAATATAPAALAADVPMRGRSAEGRPIVVHRLGPADAPARVLVVGSIHGDEPGGLLVTRRLRRRGPPPGVALYVIGTLNPDGLARGTRQNARGVDLNRNFPRGWRPQGRRGSTFYSGPRPRSEPETRFAMRLIAALRPDATIWLHQPFGLVDPAAGADPDLVRRYARAAGLPVRLISGGLRGTATSWQNARIPRSSAFVVELTAGRPSAARVSRHVRAVRLVASRVACVEVGRCRRRG